MSARNIKITLLATVLLCASVLSVPHAAAQMESNALQSTLSMIGTGVSMATTVLNFFGLLIIRVLEYFLQPNIIFQFDSAGGTAGGISTKLREIWILSRDIVNVLLALVLIVMAVLTVVRGSTENLKNIAPKLVIALIAVNFSWFIPRVVLDFAQVLTYTVYQIPQAVGQADCKIMDKDGHQQDCVVIDQVLFFKEIDKYNNEHDIVIADGAGDEPGTWHCPHEKTVCYRTIPYGTLSTNNAAYKILNGLVVNFGRWQSLSKPPVLAGDELSGDDMKAVVDFILRIIITLVFHVAIVFPLLALLFAFMVRIPILWITIAFMPFVVLAYALEGSPFAQLGTTTKKIQDEFLSIAFLPVLTGVPLAVGFVMIQVGVNATPPGGLDVFTTESIIPDIGSLWGFVWMLTALGVLWIGVFAALKKNAIVAMVSEPLKNFGQSVGRLVAEMPLGLPLIPMPGSKTGERMGLLKGYRMAQGAMSSYHATGDWKSLHDTAADGGKSKVTNAINNNPNANFKNEFKNQFVLQMQRATTANFEGEMRRIREKMASEGVTGVNDRKILEGIEAALPEFSGQLTRKLDEFERTRGAAPAAGGGGAGAAPAAGGAAPAAGGGAAPAVRPGV